MSKYDAFNAARILISEQNIRLLPVNPFEIAKKLCIPIYTYTEARNFGFLEQLQTLKKIKADAFCYKSDSSNYIIFYDEQVKPEARIKFTIAHEIGHIRLGHHEHSGIIPRYLTTKKNDPIENEADAFAGELIRPSALLTLIGLNYACDIADICDITYRAACVAERQVRYLKRCLSFEGYKDDFQFYSNQFYNYIHQKHCSNCHYEFILPNANYCPICGNNKLEFGKDEEPMHYKNYDIYPGFRAKQCVRCENEDIDINHDFCMICGTDVVNRCYGTWIENPYDEGGYYDQSNSCGQPLPPHARFCPYCGSETLYGIKNIIKSWEDEYKELKKTESQIPLPPLSLLKS